MKAHSLLSRTDGTMKFTRPSEFNDPFDCDPEVDENKYINYMGAERKDLLKKAGKSLGLSPAERIQQKGVMLKRLKTAIQNDEFGQKAVDNDVGICSLSRDPLNLLMWAHYAKNHTGFVIEFCIPTEIESEIKPKLEDAFNWLVPHEVKYEEIKPKIYSNDGTWVNFEKRFLVKGHDWAYEQEERVIDHVRGHGIHPYERKIILKSVIAGMRMYDDHFVMLKNTVEAMNTELGTNVAVYRAKHLKGKFALFAPGRDDLSSNP